MKFADKYEILEMVTSGRVSTFLARERASQEAVVVYTFECAGTGAGELSTASIIARFCALAPNPPGIIVKAGFDEPSSSAFITTKMPEAVALKAWVGAYQAFVKPGAAATGADRPVANAARPAADETAELSAEEVRAMLAKSGPPPKQPPVENLAEDMGGVTAAFTLDIPATEAPQSGGEFTRLFREANAFEPVQRIRTPAPPAAPKPSDATDAMFGELLGGSPLGGHKPAGPPPPPKMTPVPPEPSPGSFTREFMGLSNDRQAAPVEKPTPVEPRAAEKEPGAFTREFMAVSQRDFQKSDPPARQAPPVAKSSPPPATSFESIFGSSTPIAPAGATGDNQKAGAGEFTSFFRDPFESPGAPQKPVVVPDVASSTSTKPPVGDFTQMFGRDDISRAQPGPLPTVEPEPAPASAGSFTQMFGEIPSAKKSPGSQLGGATLGTDANVRPTFLEPAGVPPSPAIPPRAVTPVPAPPADSIFSRTPPPVAPAANSPFMNRAGSNEATDMFRMPAGDAPPMDAGPSGPSEFTVFLSRGQVNAAMAPPTPPTFAAPPAPHPPPFQFAPPPPPAAPAPPAMKMPTAPAAPALPTMPAPSAPAKAAGFWPLIVVLTVLLAIGAMLVMYFVLKH